MSERYWVTGVQLGMVVALDTFEERKKLMESIIDKQFIGNKQPLPIIDIIGNTEEKPKKDSADIPYPAGHNWEGLTPNQVNSAYNKPSSDEKITEGQLDFIQKLQSEGYIPEDFDGSKISKKEADKFIKAGISKRDSKGVEY